MNIQNFGIKKYSKKTIIEELELTTKDKKFPSSLFGVPDQHFKLKKNELESGVRSYPHNLAPSKISGFNTCASSSPQCEIFCLHFSGLTFQYENKENARVKRTKAFFQNREWYLRLLQYEIDTAILKGLKDNIPVSFRLNTTSDIKFESVYFDNGMSVPDYIHINGGEVYDYTKHINRHTKTNFPQHYHLTFSWSGDNYDNCLKAFESGLNIAIAFNSNESSKRKLKTIIKKPKYFQLGNHKIEIINGDKTDYRPSDKSGVIVGLDYKFNKELKGTFNSQLLTAIESGFVIDVNDSRCIS